MKINDSDLAFSRNFIKDKIGFAQKYKLNFDDVIFSSSTNKRFQTAMSMILYTPALRSQIKNFYFKQCIKTKTAKLCISLNDDTEVLLGNYFHCNLDNKSNYYFDNLNTLCVNIAKHPTNNQSKIVFTNRMKSDSFLLLICYEETIDIFHILEKDFSIYKKYIQNNNHNKINKIIIIDNFRACNILNWDLTYQHSESEISSAVFLYYDNFWKVVMQSEHTLNLHAQSQQNFQELKIFNLNFID